MPGFTVDNHIVTLTNGNDAYYDIEAKNGDGSPVDAGAIYGLDGDDIISGGYYTGRIDGGAGDDFLFGGANSGVEMIGGSGRNIYVAMYYSVPTFTGNVSDYRLERTGPTSGIFVPKDGSGVQVVIADPQYVAFNGTKVAYTDLSSVMGVTTRAHTDLVGNGASDILWRNANGQTTLWTVDTGSFHAGTFNAPQDATWHIVDTLDADGDGRADILWRNDNGAVGIWNAHKDQMFTVGPIDGSVGNDWRIAATGAFSGDILQEILWQHEDGSIQIWHVSMDGFISNVYAHASVGTDWKVEGAGDFNGDGRDDILWRNDSGKIETWLSQGTGFLQASYDNAGVGRDWKIEGIGDFNGDGRDDIVWRHDNGSISIWNATGPDAPPTGLAIYANTGFSILYNNSGVGNDWQIAGVGDYNNDGKADLMWRHDDGRVQIWESTGSGFAIGAVNGYASADWTIAGHFFPL